MAVNVSPHHERTGDALGYYGKVVRAKLRCLACGKVQSEIIDSSVLRSEATKDLSCDDCGRLGMMRAIS